MLISLWSFVAHEHIFWPTIKYVELNIDIKKRISSFTVHPFAATMHFKFVVIKRFQDIFMNIKSIKIPLRNMKKARMMSRFFTLKYALISYSFCTLIGMHFHAIWILLRHLHICVADKL